MECGKLTAKLRDAVPVCFIEDGKEIQRFKNIEIPDELKVLPFKDFKFDVPATGAITFKIMFEAGILPKEWPQARERKSRGGAKTVNIPKETADILAASIRNGGYADAETVAAMKKAEEEAAQETTTALAIIQPDPLADIIEAAQQLETLEAGEQPAEDAAMEETEVEPEAEQPIEDEAAEEAEAMVEPEQPAEEIEAAPENSTTMVIAFNITGDRRKALVEAVSSFIGTKPVYQNAPTFGYAIGEYTVDKKGTLTGPQNDGLLQALAARNFIAE